MMTRVYYLLQVCTARRILRRWIGVQYNYTKYNDTKFITHENFQLSGFQKCAKVYTLENFYVYGNYFLVGLPIRQTFFRQTVRRSQFAKHYSRQTFPPYGISYRQYICTCMFMYQYMLHTSLLLLCIDTCTCMHTHIHKHVSGQ